MVIKRLLPAIPIIFTATLLSVTRADASGPQLKLQGATIKLDPIADPSLAGGKWSHGVFIYMVLGKGTSPGPFYILDRGGSLISTVMPSIPGQFYITDFDRATDGTLVLVGGSFSTDGQLAPFLVWISPDGQTSRIVRTGCYNPHQVSIGPDGTVWTVGLEMLDRNPWAPGLDPNAGVLRHFDAQGKLIASAGPQSQFKGNAQKGRLYNGYLVALKDRVGWYSGTEGKGNYVEISPDTMTPHGYPGLPQLSPIARVVGFALTDTGNVFISFEDHQPVALRPPNLPHRRVYMLDRGSNSWVLVDTPAIDSVAEPHLMGSDGTQLVFRGSNTFGFASLAP